MGISGLGQQLEEHEPVGKPPPDRAIGLAEPEAFGKRPRNRLIGLEALRAFGKRPRNRLIGLEALRAFGKRPHIAVKPNRTPYCSVRGQKEDGVTPLDRPVEPSSPPG